MERARGPFAREGGLIGGWEAVPPPSLHPTCRAWNLGEGRAWGSACPLVLPHTLSEPYTCTPRHGPATCRGREQNRGVLAATARPMEDREHAGIVLLPARCFLVPPSLLAAAAGQRRSFPECSLLSIGPASSSSSQDTSAPHPAPAGSGTVVGSADGGL